MTDPKSKVDEVVTMFEQQSTPKPTNLLVCVENAIHSQIFLKNEEFEIERDLDLPDQITWRNSIEDGKNYGEGPPVRSTMDANG